MFSIIPTLFLGGIVAFLPQESRCASCHIANPDAPARYHLSDWEWSAHKSTGCEECHKSDAETFEFVRAHQEILSSRNPASPVNRRNLPATCGSCHTGQFVAFQYSRHYALLREGNTDTPVCTTCHREVAARLLSPKALANQCSKCHGEGRIAPHPEYPVQAREMLEAVEEVRASLKSAQRLIRRIKDRARRESMEEVYQQAEVPLIEAVNAGHRFVFDQLQDRLGVARRRTTQLLDTLANQESRPSNRK